MLSPLDQAIQEIIAAGKRLDALNLTPATAGNFSIRLKDGRIAITVSGKHKGRLAKDDIMTVDKDGKALENKKPSAETLLHAHIYSLYPETGAILHGHSVAGVALAREPSVKEIVLENYELLKVFSGIDTHDTSLIIPVVENSQDMEVIQRELGQKFKKNDRVVAYLIRNHGFYVWGKNMAETESAVEALEHLLQCELEIQKLGVAK